MNLEAVPELWEKRRATRLAHRKHREACVGCRAYWCAPVGTGYAYSMCREGTRLYEEARAALVAVTEAAGVSNPPAPTSEPTK